MEWISVKEKPLPEDETFLAVVDNAAGKWVGFGIYAYHYDAVDRCPGKYEFFYISYDPENEGLQFRKEDKDQMEMITHWMPLPEPPND